MAVFNVPYTPGELKAIGYSGGKVVNTAILKTADESVKIKLSPDKKRMDANGEDLCYITVELVDSKGVRNPKAENLVRFEVEGAGTIAGVGNANPVSLESYQQPQRNAWQGRCMVIIKAGKHAGDIKLKAVSDGIRPAETIIRVGPSQ